MTELDCIRIEYERLDKITGVDTSGIEISISGRLKNKLGYFSIQKKDLFSKKLSIVISKNALKEDNLFLDVIRHEYAHALVYLRDPHSKHGHDRVWKAACKEVGCNPKATIDYYKYVPVRELSYKYLVVCKNCHSESKYKSNSQVVKCARGDMPGEIYCRRCKGNEFMVYDIKDSSSDQLEINGLC